MSDFSLPAKRVQRAPVADRLTDTVRTRVLPARYLQCDAAGEVVETPDELFRRVASGVARAEAEYGGDPAYWTDRFYERMTALEFVPNSPTLMNAGTDGQLSACFVISPDDSLDSIFTTLGQAAKVFQSGGGVGYDFSRLRPQGDPVHSTGGVASGPVSFMQVFDTMCEQLRQGGRRRGAQMAVLRVDHPDVGRFCTAKRREGALRNFNVSVGVTDDFVAAVRADDDYDLVNPRTGAQHVVTDATAEFYSPDAADASPAVVASNLWRDYAAEIPGLDPYRDRIDLVVDEPMSLPAGLVWTLAVDGAWRNGEPGLFALDTTNRDHSFDVEKRPAHRIEATNPCGEQPLENFEACTLGHVNLSLVVNEGVTPWFDRDRDRDRTDTENDLAADVERFLDDAIDFERLRDVVHDGVRFLDDVVTVSTFPVDDITEAVHAGRKIGLGVMGFAELLVQLGVRYGSPASIEVARQVMAFVDHESKLASHELAGERGTFPTWDESKWATPTRYSDWFRRHTGLDADEWPDGFPLRNHNTTTVAPTGTTGMIAATSSGCEPLFNVVNFRNVAEDVQRGETLVEIDPYFLDVLAANGYDPDDVRAEARSLLADGRFEGPESLSIPSDLAALFVTAGEVAPEQHVRVQAAFQEHVDSGISKTVNVPESATREDVDAAFRLALETGCKGITVYRDRSRESQVLTTRPAERGVEEAEREAAERDLSASERWCRRC